MTLTLRLRPLWFSVVAALALGAFSEPSTARAQTGIEAGVRLGYGIPLGEAAKDSDLGDGISGQIPIWLDLGYRPIDALMIGLYFQYGIGMIGSSFDDVCDVDGVDCSASDIRLGVQAHYHISPTEQLDPWIGLGIGYEWASISAEGMGAEITTTFDGFEFLNLQGGLDISVAEHVKIGPFLSFSLGQYGSASSDCSGSAACGAVGSIDGDIEDKAIHEWLLIGVRGAYTP